MFPPVWAAGAEPARSACAEWSLAGGPAALDAAPGSQSILPPALPSPGSRVPARSPHILPANGRVHASRSHVTGPRTLTCYPSFVSFARHWRQRPRGSRGTRGSREARRSQRATISDPSASEALSALPSARLAAPAPGRPARSPPAFVSFQKNPASGGTRNHPPTLFLPRYSTDSGAG